MRKKAVALFLTCAGMALGVSCGKTSSHFVYAAILNASEILVYREDPNSGALTPLSQSPVTAGPGVQSLVFHPSKKFLYAANSSEDDISLFTIAATGALTEVTPRTPVKPTGVTPAFLAMDPAGSFLYVGNAETRNISIFSIDASFGTLTAVAGSPFPIGISPLNMALSPSGKFLYVTGTAGSQSYVESFSLSGLTMQPPQFPLVQAAFTGANPYGLVIDPSGTHLYTANFTDNSISEFKINADGSLAELSGSPFGQSATYASPIWLLVDNSGKYLYVANEGSGGQGLGSGNLSAYAIGSDGGLTLLSASPFITNAQPSVIASDPSGKYLFVGNQKNAAIESFGLATSDGSLSEVASYSVANSATSIVVLP
jgi:6-phosphogluconolactonase (cycloisomerase 2 family)